MMEQGVSLLVVLTCLLCGLPAQGVEADLRGRLSARVSLSPEASSEWLAEIRYFPELSLLHEWDGTGIDALAALRARADAGPDASHHLDEDAEVAPYRLWARLCSEQFELRGGLQKLNFGQATLLRPLMWFDRIDPRDSLGLTDGVYGLLGRYYFLNNARLWAWGLYGNGDPKGWEVFPTVETEPEYGGRLQLPLLGGELGISCHRRVAEVPGRPADPRLPPAMEIVEDRLGVDVRWDIEVGLWLEAAVNRLDLAADGSPYTSLAVAGLDYTVNWGNGLHVLFEHLVVCRGDDPFDPHDTDDVSAALLQYPIGLVDTVRCIVNYDWEADDWFRFCGWERAHDEWALHLNAFWNPAQRSAPGRAGTARYAGTGVQVLLVLNH